MALLRPPFMIVELAMKEVEVMELTHQVVKE
jgi:hypothetical protein